MGTKALERKDASLAKKALAIHDLPHHIDAGFPACTRGLAAVVASPFAEIECLGVAVDAGLTIGLAQLSLATSALSYGALKFLKNKDTPSARSCNGNVTSTAPRFR
jgi:hypothetical protein